MTLKPIGTRQMFLQSLAARQPLPRIAFAPNQIISDPIEKRVHFYGAALRVPPQTCAVLAFPDGSMETYQPGDHIIDNLPAGRYLLRYVDLHYQRLELHVLKAQTKDAWDVGMRVVVVWHVVEPTEVLDLAEPFHVLSETCLAALTDLIQAHQHDELVASPEGKTHESRMVAAELQSRLKDTPRLAGIEVVNAVVLEKAGDRRRVEAVQKKIVETTELEQERLLETERLRLRKQQIDNELNLAHQEEDLRVQQAHVNRRRMEEEEQVRLERARIAVEEDNRMFIIRQRQQALELAMLQQQQQHEQAMKAWEMGANAFSNIAAAILQNQAAPGMMRPIDDAGRDALIQAVLSITQSMPAIQPRAALLSPAGDLQERLKQEIFGLLTLENTAAESPRECGEDGIIIPIHYKKLHILVEVGPNYPTEAPRHIIVSNGNSKKEEIRLKWSPDRNLREIVLEVATRMASQAPFRQYPVAE